MENTGMTCSQCGAPDITLIDEKFAKCNVCGATLKISKRDEISSTIIVKHVDEDKGGKAPKTAFLKIKENHQIEDFTRTAYIDLFSSSVTDEVCGATFSPAVVKTKNYLLVSGEYELNYSANLGFDRKEKYLGTERKKQQDGTYVEEIVEKERTVTDWRPTSGVYKGSNNAVRELGDDDVIAPVVTTQQRFNDLVLNNTRENLEGLLEKNNASSPFEIGQGDLKNVYKWGAKMVSEKCYYSLGGNHVKDFNYSYKEKPNAIVGIVSNEFVLPYSVGDRKYSVTSFSNKIVTHCTGPREDVDNAIRKANGKKSKKSLIIPPVALFVLLFLLIFIPLMIGTGVADLAFGAGLMGGLFPSGIAFVIWWNVHSKTWDDISKKEADIIKHEREVKKYKRLVELLKEYNFKPLSEDEESQFVYLKQQQVEMKPLEKFVLWVEDLSFERIKELFKKKK